MWILSIYTNGSRINNIITGLVDYSDAENYIQRLYGDDVVVTGQDFVTDDETPRRGWSLFG